MRLIVSITLFFSLTYQSLGQNNFIQIETNKTLGLFSFLETSSHQLGTSRSFREYIFDSLGQDDQFIQLINSYSSLNLDYSIERREFPDKRPSSTSIRDLLWITVSNSNSIDDFSQRIIGFLPHITHYKLIEILKNTESYYDELIWNKEQDNILRIESQLDDYKEQITDLYLSISQFYNTSWSTTIPFKIMLYPIPLKYGFTSAIPMGNALICNFLSHNENDYKVRLGIVIHEMCHILYKEQNSDFQKQIDQWFTNSASPYASLAYSFINEGLATVLGNGWAYKQIHKTLDSREWYDNKHIDGFAHALYPLTEQYLTEGKSIDENFVNKAIELFAETFPKATVETAILMNSIQLFANTEEKSKINEILNNIHNYFNIRSMWFSSPTLSIDSKDVFDEEETTKLFIIDSDHENTIIGLQEHFSYLKIETPINTIDIIKDEKAKSTLIIMNIEGLSKLNDAYSVLSNITYLEDGKNYEIK